MKRRLIRLANIVYFLLRNFRLREFGRKLLKRIYSNTVSYGLRRDLTASLKVPRADIPLTIRPFEPTDANAMFVLANSNLTRSEREDYVTRLLLIDEKLPRCYVAVTDQGSPCFIQWLVTADQNDRLQVLYNGAFPRLKSDEALLENAYVTAPFRGKHVMPEATTLIGDKGREFGVSWVITFIHERNIASLKAHKRAGFLPYLVRTERWLLFVRFLTFTAIASSDSIFQGIFT